MIIKHIIKNKKLKLTLKYNFKSTMGMIFYMISDIENFGN